MIAEALDCQATDSLIRPVRLPLDLLGLADLLEAAFDNELVMTDSHMVEDMRQMARLGAFLWTSGGPRLGGYVYVADERIVGNITLSQDPRDQSSWFISNVAVLPAYRGQGIAGRLMDTALACIRRMRGRWVRLQVRADHPVAYGLYQRRGFITFDSTYEMKMASRLLNASLARVDHRLRPARPRDNAALWQLVARTSTPLLLQRRALHPADYRRTWLSMLDNQLEYWLSGAFRQEVVGYEDSELTTYGSLRADAERSPYYCELRVLPECRGGWEDAVVRQLLMSAIGRPRRNVHASISTSHPEAITALQELGFIRQRTLAQMSLDLG